MSETTAARPAAGARRRSAWWSASKMDKTVVVAVEKTIMHRLYQRYQKRTSKFYAHDEENSCKVGRPGAAGGEPAAVAAQALAREPRSSKRAEED